MKCLVVNDDGTHSPGLALVEETIRARGAHCLTVAPARDQSGRGGSITLSEPLHVWTVGQDRWAVSGTPADCVRIALAYLRYQPDLIVSGVNLGSNLGDDIYASGTVGAARFGGLRGIPSCALSAASLRWELNRSLLARHWPAIVKAAESSNEVLNVNFPAFDGTRITLARLAGSRYRDQITSAKSHDEVHRVELQSIPCQDDEAAVAGTDVFALAHGWTTFTHLPWASARDLNKLAVL